MSRGMLAVAGRPLRLSSIGSLGAVTIAAPATDLSEILVY
jgi:hypothetical protein